MPASAYNLKFRALYFNNFLEIQYLQVGPEFTSLANPYFPKNTREFSIIDKIWILKRRMQTSINYKSKTNDILEANSNPYYENTIGINLNYIPGGSGVTMLETEWQQVPPNKKDVKFFHGCKSPSELQKVFDLMRVSKIALVTLFDKEYSNLAK